MLYKKVFSAIKHFRCSICSEPNCPVRNMKGRKKVAIVHNNKFVTKCPKDKQRKDDMYTHYN